MYYGPVAVGSGTRNSNNNQLSQLKSLNAQYQFKQIKSSFNQAWQQQQKGK